MKTYIKPYTYCTLLTEESHILAGSDPASTKRNQANSQGTGVFAGGSSSEYTGLIYDEIQGWCYVENGKINYDYNGLKSNEYGWWKITGGKVDFGYTGLVFDEQVGWWFVNNGAIDSSGYLVIK